MNIHFEKAKPKHADLIFTWLAQPHIMEFWDWDNTPEYKQNILNSLHGKNQHYFYGTTLYWIASFDKDPYGFLLSEIFQKDQDDLSPLHKQYLSKSGHTIGLDFGIGNTKYLGTGLAAPTLNAFVHFYHTQIDPLADTFFTDPDQNNPRAEHVYAKAGFERVGQYNPQAGAFIGQISYLMIKKI